MPRNEDWVKSEIEGLSIDSENSALDIGANHGIYTKILCEKFNKVYAIEPHPYNISVLESELNRDNVVLEQKAISDFNGKIKLYIHENEHDRHTTVTSMAETGRFDHSQERLIEVDAVTLDTFCENKKIKFIKCDIEGAEYKIFYSGKEMLERDHPTIILETHQVFNFDSDQKERDRLKNYFTKLGYKIFNSDGKEIDHMTYDTHYIIKY